MQQMSSRLGKVIKVREIQSVLGLLAFVAGVMPMGRIFCRRTVLQITGIKNPKFNVQVSKDMREDLCIWLSCMDKYTGCSVWQGDFIQAVQLKVFTDAAGAHDFQAFFDGKWCAESRDRSWFIVR